MTTLSANESKKVTDVLFKEVIKIINKRGGGDSVPDVLEHIRTQLEVIDTFSRHAKGKKKVSKKGAKKRKLSSPSSPPPTPGRRSGRGISSEN